MRRSVAVPALLTLLSAWTLPAQTRALPPLVERVEVTVVNVEAIVTDRDGRRVTGLSRDDFEIHENGKRQRITNFYEVASASQDEGTPRIKVENRRSGDVVPNREPLRLAVVVDKRSLQVSTRENLLKQVGHFVDSAFLDGDEVMLGVWDLKLSVPVAFTSERAALLNGLANIGSGAGLSLDAAAERTQDELKVQQAIDEALARGRGYTSLPEMAGDELLALETRIEMRRKAAGLRDVIRRMSGMDGRKVMLFLTQKFPFCAVVSPQCSPDFDLQPLIDTVSEAANANGVVLYTVFSAPNPLEMTGAERARVSSFEEASRSTTKDFLSSSGLEHLARATGGVSTTGPEITRYLTNVQEDLASYYSLGYRATRAEEGQTREIRVVAKDPRYRVRTRKSVVEKSAERQLSDQLVSYIFDPDASTTGSLPFEVTLGTLKPQPRGRFLLPTSISLSLRDITLIEEGGTYRGGFFVHVVSVDQRGDLSDVTRKQHRIEIPAAEVASLRDSSLTYELELLIDRRGERVALAVVDEMSGATEMKSIDLPPR